MKTSIVTLRALCKKLLVYSDVANFLVLWAVAFCVGPRTWVWLVGLFLATVGFSLWMTARRQLGVSFSVRAKATELVTSGLYRYFRHPIYLFGAVATFGALLAIQKWWLVGVWLAYALPIQCYRLRKENETLMNAFGEEFLQHRQKTWI